MMLPLVQDTQDVSLYPGWEPTSGAIAKSTAAIDTAQRFEKRVKVNLRVDVASGRPTA